MKKTRKKKQKRKKKSKEKKRKESNLSSWVEINLSSLLATATILWRTNAFRQRKKTNESSNRILRDVIVSTETSEEDAVVGEENDEAAVLKKPCPFASVRFKVSDFLGTFSTPYSFALLKAHTNVCIN